MQYKATKLCLRILMAPEVKVLANLIGRTTIEAAGELVLTNYYNFRSRQSENLQDKMLSVQHC
jgi:hypothetical protein